MSSFDSGSRFLEQSAPPKTTSLPSVCPACQSTAISTTAKTPDANSYWRCGSCGEVWNASRRQGSRGGRGWR